ncbi:MAG: PfkB family carbohydrate kinase [Acidobacteriota bacterium]
MLDLVARFSGQKVVLLADLVADRFLHGAPKRISREAPVLILRLERETTIPGGGANAVANVAALDGAPLALGAVGDDLNGRELLHALTARGVDIRGVQVAPGYRTPTKTRVLAGGRHAIKQQVVRYDVEDEWRPDAGALEKLGADLDLDGVGAAVLSDYGDGAVSRGSVEALRGRLGDVPVLGDSRYRLDALGGLDGATPNLEEAEELAGGPLELDDDLRRGGRLLLERLGARFLLITRGSAGMSLFEADALYHLPVHGTDQVADVTGAGDTVIGTFALALAAGASPLEAACLANYAGGTVVMKMGTATLGRAELETAVRDDASLLRAIRREGYGREG